MPERKNLTVHPEADRRLRAAAQVLGITVGELLDHVSARPEALAVAYQEEADKRAETRRKSWAEGGRKRFAAAYASELAPPTAAPAPAAPVEPAAEPAPPAKAAAVSPRPTAAPAGQGSGAA